MLHKGCCGSYFTSGYPQMFIKINMSRPYGCRTTEYQKNIINFSKNSDPGLKNRVNQRYIGSTLFMKKKLTAKAVLLELLGVMNESPSKDDQDSLIFARIALKSILHDRESLHREIIALQKMLRNGR